MHARLEIFVFRSSLKNPWSISSLLFPGPDPHSIISVTGDQNFSVDRIRKFS